MSDRNSANGSAGMTDNPISPDLCLLPHQETAVRWLLDHPRAVLADDVGLGKTVQACALIGALSERGDLPRLAGKPGIPSPARVVWLTGATLLEQTRAEVERFLPGLTVQTNRDKGFGAMRRNGPPGPDVAVVNYEGATSKGLRGWLDALRPSLVVLDEASNVANEGKRARALIEMTARAERVVAMTATPLQNDPLELYAVLNIAHTPGLWRRSDFEEEFVTWRQASVDPWGRPKMVPEGWRPDRLGEVREYLSGVLLARSVKEVGLELPTKVGEGNRWVPLTQEQRDAYDASVHAPSALSAHHRKEAAGRAVGSFSALADELLRELYRRGDEQAVVYCESLDVLAIVAERLTSAGVSHVQIDGSTAQKDRPAAIERFRSGEVRVLLGSSVLEHGLNLQFCRLLISLDCSWNPAREQQREGRICRIGSPHATYEHLRLLPDTRLTREKLARLGKKAATAAQVR